LGASWYEHQWLSYKELFIKMRPIYCHVYGKNGLDQEAENFDMDRLNIKPQTFCDLVEIEETAPAWVTSTIIFYYSYSITTVTWIEQLSHNQITLRKLS